MLHVIFSGVSNIEGGEAVTFAQPISLACGRHKSYREHRGAHGAGGRSSAKCARRHQGGARRVAS